MGRENNIHKREDLFAATPPLEASKVILSMAATSNRGETIMINDVSRAFFHAKAKRPVYVQLAKEDQEDGQEQMCGRLNFSMYGTRDAAQNWYEEYSQHLLKIGLTQGLAIPCVFHHRERGIRTVVHGDDYVSTGSNENLQWMKARLEEKYQIKTQLLGPRKDQQQEVKILNGIVTWDQQRGLRYEADPRHVEILLKQLELEDAKEVTAPGTKDEGHITEKHKEPLSEENTSRYRALVARCNYISPDRPGIAYTVKELARAMAAPTNGDWQRLKRLGLYSKENKRLIPWYDWQPTQSRVKTYSDADWAGCRETRKSTTGGCITIGKHIIKTRSKTQSFIALSSGESELYSTLKAAAETLGLPAMLKDMGWLMKGEIWSDANAAIGIINRNGLGKTRHIETGLLWVQQTAAQQRLSFNKVLGKDNPADLFTKYMDLKTIDHHLDNLDYHKAEGRAVGAPQLHIISRSLDDVYIDNDHDEQHMCDWVNVLTDELTTNKAGPMVVRRRCSSQICCSPSQIFDVSALTPGTLGPCSSSP